MTNSHLDKKHNERSNEKDPIFTVQNVWYFRTEDGETIGPFRYRSEAESNLDRFLKQLETQLSDR
ncbi:MAG: DUF6316 family protein [Gammaproteobacteria bacterium]|nr:DUF6316 family protein [Gammaproteobacteria bacterium]